MIRVIVGDQDKAIKRALLFEIPRQPLCYIGFTVKGQETKTSKTNY